MIDGDLMNLSTNKNYTEDAKAAIRISEIDALGESNMVAYNPETVKHTITVVTDIDCSYCRRLHKEIPQYLGNSIKVRYIFMPLKGNEDINKTVSVWCADNRKAALDVAYANGVIESKVCDNPIVKHMELTRKLGVRGTPAIILENGDMLPGFLRVNKLLTELNLLNVSSVQ